MHSGDKRHPRKKGRAVIDAAKTALAVIGAYTVVSVLFSIRQYFRDRSGNSGRAGKHWSQED